MKNYFQYSDYLKNIGQIKKSLKDDGFFVIRNFFSDEDIKKMILLCDDFCKESVGVPFVHDLIRYDKIRRYAFQKDLIKLMTLLIGNDDLYYFGDSTIHFEPNKRIFHTDARPEGFVEKYRNYPIFRVGIYLQDHFNHSGGLKLRKGSHNKMIYNKQNIKGLIKKKFKVHSIKSLFNIGRVVNLKSKTGDLAIWNIKVEHSGGAVIPKLFSNLAFWPSIDNIIPPFLKKAEHKKRYVIFNAFGKNSEALNHYVKFRELQAKKHKYKYFYKEDYDDDVISFSKTNNFKLFENF